MKYKGIRHVDIVAARMKASAGCERYSVDSRQQRRARARKESFAQITKMHGPEPRKARRGIALVLARKATKRVTA